MLNAEDLPLTGEGLTERDFELLRRDLLEARVEIRALRRQLEKAMASATEAQRAHAKMVVTLTETMRENTSLTNERDMWRTRAERLESGLSADSETAAPIDISVLASQISPDELNAIRKAMARLHHPDLGGNPERMKAWNAALDRIAK